MEHIYGPVLDLAQSRRLAVLDLPRSFDIYDDGLYEHQIEPSHKGGELIARLIAQAIQEHTAPETASCLYRERQGELTVESNEKGSSTWSIPHEPSTVPGGVAGSLSDREEKIKAIVGMGFARSSAEEALEQSGGDTQAAVTALLSAS